MQLVSAAERHGVSVGAASVLSMQLMNLSDAIYSVALAPKFQNKSTGTKHYQAQMTL